MRTSTRTARTEPTPTKPLELSDYSDSDSSRDAAKITKRIASLIERTERDAWDIADSIVEAIDGYSLSLRQLAAFVAWGKSQLGEYYNVAKDFPPDVRADGVSFHTYREARNANNRKPERMGSIKIRLTTDEITEAINAGKREPRQIASHINDITNERQKSKMKREAKKAPLNTQTYNKPWEQVASDLKPKSINGGVWADPPYGAHQRDSGKEEASAVGHGGAFLPSCADNADAEGMKRTTYALFDLLPDKLADNAPLFVIQHGTHYPREIIDYGEARGWKTHTPIVWHFKKSPSASYLAQPFAPTFVFILCFTYGEDSALRNLVGGANGNVITDIYTTNRVTINDVKRGTVNPHEHHVYEHPPELVEEIFSRFLIADSEALIFEPFGCTGAASRAAIANGWRYIYCESHEENYERGKIRIERAKQRQKRKRAK